jgi:hypothetical protein
VPLREKARELYLPKGHLSSSLVPPLSIGFVSRLSEEAMAVPEDQRRENPAICRELKLLGMGDKK